MSAAAATAEVLVTGTGALGSWALEFLARSSGLTSIAAADLDGTRGEALVWRAAVGASQQGFMPRMSFHQLDLKNVDATAGLLEQLRPMAIFHTATLLPIWAISADVDPHLFARFREVGFGLWLPFHLLLTHRLMQAVKQSRLPIDVIDAPFPDFVNPVLGKVGLAPLGGCGNVDNLAGGLRLLVAQRYGVGLQDVRVYMVASHAVSESFTRTLSSGGMPYRCQVYVCGGEVSSDLDIESLLSAYAKRVRGVPMEARVASSAVKSLLAIVRSEVVHTHVPGPNGLSGGYPVRLGRGRAEIALPPLLTMEEAQRVNLVGLRKGGIEAIQDDGTVVLTPPVTECLREVFNLELRQIRLADIEGVANELRLRYRAMVAKH